MKYIKLFESFKNVNESGSLDPGLVFDWRPFDDQVNNPMNESIPRELSYSDLVNFSKESDNKEKSIGLYMAHQKIADGGFIRLVTTDINPLIFNVGIFDKDFNKKTENKGILADKFDPSSFIKGSDIINRYRF